MYLYIVYSILKYTVRKGVLNLSQRDKQVESNMLSDAGIGPVVPKCPNFNAASDVFLIEVAIGRYLFMQIAQSPVRCF